jgi:hypothetical protein
MSSDYVETAEQAVQTNDTDKIEKVTVWKILFRKTGQWTGYYSDRLGRVFKFVEGPPGNYQLIEQFEKDLPDNCKSMFSGRDRRTSGNQG